MQIQYALSPDDLWRYNKFVVRRTPSFLLTNLIRLLSVPVGILVLFWSQQFSAWLCLAATAGIAYAWIPFCLWSGRRTYMKTWQQQPGLLGAHTLSLTTDGVKQTSPNTESLMKWEGFCEIVETPHQVLLFVTKRFAVVIPKHAFSSQAEAAAFLEASKAYQNGKPFLMAENSNVWPPPPRVTE